MKRFNLSGWAVSHPTLILFLMIALGAAGFFSYQRLGRAEDPFFTVKVVNVSAIWPGATAQEMQTQVADPIEKKLQELPFFEKVQTYSKPSFTAMQVTFKRSDPAKGRAVSVLSAAQEAGRRAGPVAGGPARPDRQRRILRRRFDPLHDDRRRRRLRAVEEGRRRHAPAAVEGDLASPRSISTAPRTSASSSNSRTPSWRRSASRRRRCSICSPSRTTSRRPVPSKPPRSACRCASPARSTASRRLRRRRSKATAACSGLGDIATVTHGFVDPPTFVGAPGRQARARHRRGHRQGRQHPRARQGGREGDRRNS